MQIPEFPKGLSWYNTPPLSWNRDLRGKILLLDFWTFCCINCMHTLPDVAYLARKYCNDPVAIIGVHSAKFSHEKVGEHVRQAMLRYGVHHPVVNDPDMAMWKALGVRAWPTLALIDPEGEVVALYSGEGRRGEIESDIDQILATWSPEKFNPTPLPIRLEEPSPTHLRYPGKLAVDPGGTRLFVADTGHHSIAILSPQGEELGRIGCGQPGWRDGSWGDAALHAPQGIVYREGKLYIADTENHLIRCAHLSSQEVTTLVGTGELGHDYRGGKRGLQQTINSPWDLALVGHSLYIAMAGLHQIWLYDLHTDKAFAYSGSGAELHLNSSHLQRAGWAQPSGIDFGIGRLFIADSESSTIREILPDEKRTRTLVGGDPFRPHNLFAYGDCEGVESEARLQHPLGLVWWEQRQRLIVADSYNHRLQLVDPVKKSMTHWVGCGIAGHLDGAGNMAQFSEPGGLALTSDGTTLYVADTNNGCIRQVDTQSGHVSTLAQKG